VAAPPASPAGAGPFGAVYPRLQEAFAALDEAAVPWCVLRGEEELGDPRADVDLLIPAASFAQACRALAALGFARVPAPGRAPHRFLHAYDVQDDAWLKLDVVVGLAYGLHHERAVRGAGDAVVRRRRRAGGYWLPSAHDAFWTLLLHVLLDRATVRSDDLARLARLAPAAGDRPPAELRGILDPDGEWAAVGFAAARDLAGLSAIGERARAARSPGDRLRVARRTAARGLGRRVRGAGRAGLVVALLGPDGAGKSSLAKALDGTFPVPARRMYGGLYSRARRRRLPVVGRLVQSVSLGVRARLARARGAVVVFDRHPYDALVPARRAGGTRRRVARWLLARSAVRPDLVLVLDAPPEVLHARKGEHDVAELDRQRRAYETLAARFPHLATLDAGRDADVVRREATFLLWRRYAQRGGE
jgi:thymidylate kinase